MTIKQIVAEEKFSPPSFNVSFNPNPETIQWWITMKSITHTLHSSILFCRSRCILFSLHHYLAIFLCRVLLIKLNAIFPNSFFDIFQYSNVNTTYTSPPIAISTKSPKMLMAKILFTIVTVAYISNPFIIYGIISKAYFLVEVLFVIQKLE